MISLAAFAQTPAVFTAGNADDAYARAVTGQACTNVYPTECIGCTITGSATLFTGKETFVSGTQCWYEQFYMTWDTSSLPDTGPITNAVVTFYPNTRVGGCSNWYFDWFNGVIDDAAWLDTSGAATAQAIGQPVVDSWTLGAPVNIGLVNMMYINRTGRTGIKVYGNGCIPVGPTNQKHYWGIDAAEAGGGHAPTLTVYYGSATPPSTKVILVQ